MCDTDMFRCCYISFGSGLAHLNKRRHSAQQRYLPQEYIGVCKTAEFDFLNCSQVAEVSRKENNFHRTDTENSLL